MAAPVWKTFSQTNKATNSSRQALLERAQAKVLASNGTLPVRRYIAIDPEGGNHACGVNLNDQEFFARTREGALVAYLDWENANWPTNYGDPNREPYDNYPDDHEDLDAFIDKMFDSYHSAEYNTVYLREVPTEYQSHHAPSA